MKDYRTPIVCRDTYIMQVEPEGDSESCVRGLRGNSTGIWGLNICLCDRKNIIKQLAHETTGLI